MLSTVLWRLPIALFTAWVEVLTELMLETKQQFIHSEISHPFIATDTS